MLKVLFRDQWAMMKKNKCKWWLPRYDYLTHSAKFIPIHSLNSCPVSTSPCLVSSPRVTACCFQLVIFRKLSKKIIDTINNIQGWRMLLKMFIFFDCLFVVSRQFDKNDSFSHKKVLIFILLLVLLFLSHLSPLKIHFLNHPTSLTSQTWMFNKEISSPSIFYSQY